MVQGYEQRFQKTGQKRDPELKFNFICLQFAQQVAATNYIVANVSAPSKSRAQERISLALSCINELVMLELWAHLEV